MNDQLIDLIHKINPWLQDSTILTTKTANLTPRLQAEQLLSAAIDDLCLLLVGPRQAGKTTMAMMTAAQLLAQQRYQEYLYLNMDFVELRDIAKNPLFLDKIIEHFQLQRPIILLDEVQRLENPGLLLKGLIDTKPTYKLMASGSSQLELKSKVQEFLTGRNFSAQILPLSYQEIGTVNPACLLYGCYPRIVLEQEKNMLLTQLYEDYISKDIIEILKISKPDVMRRLLTLLAHGSGQLVNYQQLANDCKVSIPTIQKYCYILEQSYTVVKVTPFVANKRKEIVSNPSYYFIDNGFRNQALRQFSSLTDRSDLGLLIESAVFQEIYKMRSQHFLNFDIHFWRTQNGAEVDFVLYLNNELFIPVEVKYQRLTRPKVTKSLRSFISAYQPTTAFIITNGFNDQIKIDDCLVRFISFKKLLSVIKQLIEIFSR